jgi:integrase
MDDKECYSIIASARNLHKINRSRKISDATKYQYKRNAERLIFELKKLPIDAAKSKSSYYVYKASVISYLLDKVSETISDLDKLKSTDHQAWLNEVKKLKKCLEIIEVIGIDQEKNNLLAHRNGLFKSSWSCKENAISVKTKKSKSRQLKKLPINWSERILVQAIKSNSSHAMAIALLAISGARPVEVSLGIKLMLNSDGSINVKIRGSKSHEGKYGQSFRSFDINNDSIEIKFLRKQLQPHPEGFVITAEAGALCDSVTYFSRKCMPQLKQPATAYCFRHRFSGSLHHAGLDAELIAQALGHCSDQSQAYYSSSYRSGADGFVIHNIQAARPVNLKNLKRTIAKQSIPTIH